jgi:hypothetical protein
MPNDEKNNFKNPILRNISQKNNLAEKFLLATREIKKNSTYYSIKIFVRETSKYSK